MLDREMKIEVWMEKLPEGLTVTGMPVKEEWILTKKTLLSEFADDIWWKIVEFQSGIMSQAEKISFFQRLLNSGSYIGFKGIFIEELTRLLRARLIHIPWCNN
jgi:hypothetical protein